MPQPRRALSYAIRSGLVEQGYGPTLFAWLRWLAPQCDSRDLGRLDQLLELAYGYEAKATGRVDDFISLVKQKKVEDPRSANVRVMTVHQAKGLEFDVVVLPELEARLVGQAPQIVLGRQGPAGDVEHVLRYVSQDLRACCRSAFADSSRSTSGGSPRSRSACFTWLSRVRCMHST